MTHSPTSFPFMPPAAHQRGFTMVEMIIVITVTAIVAGMLYVFIRTPIQAYVDTAARVAASDAADTAVRRIARDVRLALPNSIRVSGDYLEFLETSGALRYQSEDDVDATLDPTLYLNWNDASKVTFAVIGGVPAGRHRPVAGNFLVVYNLGETQEPANAYNCASGVCNRATIKIVSTATITLESNPFVPPPALPPPALPIEAALKSPGHRAHVVTGPVTYHCDKVRKQLWRYSGYAITVAQGVTPPAGARAGLLASNVEDCAFRYASMASQRGALLGFGLTLGIPGQAQGTIKLEHQIHVNNTP